MILAAVILVAAFILDLLVGDPPFRFHPVRVIGFCISFLEKLLLTFGLSGLAGGILLAAGVIALSVGGYLAVRFLLSELHPWIAAALDFWLIYSCLALGDLLEHASEVAEPLDEIDLPRARGALQRIVGRDTGLLEPVAVARGAVESVAENFVDGVLSPLFWYTAVVLVCHLAGCSAPTAAGVSALVCFKAISTLDSMVGYRHGHYLLFGRASAKLDDLANFAPARLSLMFLYIGALLSGESSGSGWKVARRDRLKHLSPNAGHAESFVAGALGIRLGGPTVYQGTTVDKPWLGEGDEEVGADHIRRCCKLVYRSSWMAVLLITNFLILFSFVLQ